MKKEKNLNRKNEKLRREYEEYLLDCRGASQKTVNMFNKVLHRLLIFTDNADLTAFTKEDAVKFKKSLENEKGISARTVVSYTQQLRNFFEWLSEQAVPRKQKIKTAGQYLTVSSEIKKSSIMPTEKEIPDFDEIKRLFDSIGIEKEVDMRDRALIALLLCTGMRINALITLPLKAVDIKNNCVRQYPALGVKTKFSKSILSYIFLFDNEMYTSIASWVTYLKEVKKIDDDMPLFPKNKLLADDNTSFVDNKPWVDDVSVKNMFKKRFQKCGVKYYPPHRLRDLSIRLGLLVSENGLHVKAVSQNVGHEKVATTLNQYCTFRPEQLGKVIKNLRYENVTKDFNKWTDIC